MLRSLVGSEMCIRDSNREQKKKYQKIYDDDHKEQKKEYYDDNREQKKQYQKIYDDNHIEQKKQYYDNNKEQRKAYQRNYDKEHKKERKVKYQFRKGYIRHGGKMRYYKTHWWDPISIKMKQYMECLLYTSDAAD